jgi:hypothetical protein
MKKLHVKSIGTNIFFFSPEERSNFETETNCETSNSVGYHCEGSLWVMKSSDYSTILHECVHAVDWIMCYHLDITCHPYAVTELRAYLIEYIYKEALKYYNKHGKTDTKNIN